ncbi:mechanosensitive ion channel [Acidovorax sp. SUPP3434]|uniref:mechanosensitive ion channel family protein n=1 Tax=Acidovorax sp. SUPP3434 TaxID=2920880 RepID=UPI0023DE3396|nr:mechanosensitive ion channel domain-containing protein [Acidovorax sp. SUPP3434]GKT01957.1 mechanosensitive ion channel [Acidovorax sp. SUPP3434]
MEIFDTLSRDFNNSSTWLEIAVLAACIALAYLASRAVGRQQPADSVWFGRRTVDGLMFPLLSLALVYAARVGVEHYQPVFLLRVAVPVLTSLVLIRFFARVLTAAFPRSAAMRLVERIVSWVAWGVAVLWIVGLLPLVRQELADINISFGKSQVSLLMLLQGVLSAGLVMVLALWVSSTFERRVLSNAVNDLSMRKVAVNATRAVLLMIGMLFALSAVGVDLTALSVLGGAVGVGLGFGLQKLASNYVSGFVILLERSLRIGDNVRVDGFEGRITDIKTRYTLIRAGNGRESIVPNETLITQRVENLSDADRKFNVTTNIVVGYDSDVAQVQQILCEAAAAQARVLKEPQPVAYLVNFAPDGLEFSLNFWISDPSAGSVNLRSAINIAILEGLRGAGIDIPYPQRVVQIRGDAVPPVPAGAVAEVPAPAPQRPEAGDTGL